MQVVECRFNGAKAGWLFVCFASLFGGGALIFQQWRNTGAGEDASERLTVERTQASPDAYRGAITADSAILYSFRYDGKDAFKLAVVQFNVSNEHLSAVIYPEETRDVMSASDLIGRRYRIWQAAAGAIENHAPDESLFLSWWDDGQRIRFLSGKDAWIQKPSDATFASVIWGPLRSDLIEASNVERSNLERMARWLTMDAESAIREIVEHFGRARPIYILVNSDLLHRLAEIEAYGGRKLNLIGRKIPAGKELHGDIALVKRWAYEYGEGNYLVRHEDRYYSAWVTPKEGKAKNALLIRLLPFVRSLNQLPEGVSLVYRSVWGGFLSIYKIEPEAITDVANR